MAEKKCVIAECHEHGDWESGMCRGCRKYLARVEALPLGWRTERRELVAKWNTRLDLAISRKGTVTHIRSRSRGKA